MKKIRDDKNIQKLAEKIGDKIPVIYCSEGYQSVALRFKTQLNENPKIPAFWNYFPELNHNEILGWGSDLSKNFFAIFLRSEESSDIKKRIEFTKKIIQRKTDFAEIFSKGKSKLAKIMSLLYTGDLVSVYLAILKGVDPIPVKLIEEMKKELKK